MVNVRDARIGDVAQIIELLIEMGYARADLGHVPGFVAALATSTTDRVLIAEHEGEVVGLASLLFSDLVVHPHRSCRVIAITVRSDRRRLGIGSHLLHASEVAAREAGCLRIELTTVHENVGAHAFYREQGWTETGPRFKQNFFD